MSNEKEFFALARSGSLPEIKSFLARNKNFDVNVVDTQSRSPLSFACKAGHLEVVKYLIEKAKADYCIINKHGFTCFDEAFLACQMEVILYARQFLVCRPQEQLSEREAFVYSSSRYLPSISLNNVNLLPVECLQRSEKIPKYDQCLTELVKASSVDNDEKVLFVSHRWESTDEPDPNNHQFTVLVEYLKASEQEFRHIWIDYSCICQQPSSKEFLDHLDNIPTAIFVCSHCLIIPKLGKIPVLFQEEKWSSIQIQKQGEKFESNRKPKRNQDKAAENEPGADSPGTVLQNDSNSGRRPSDFVKNPAQHSRHSSYKVKQQNSKYQSKIQGSLTIPKGTPLLKPTDLVFLLKGSIHEHNANHYRIEYEDGTREVLTEMETKRYLLQEYEIITDLKDYVGRGWCQLEALLCMLTGCEIFCFYRLGNWSKVSRIKGGINAFTFTSRTLLQSKSQKDSCLRYRLDDRFVKNYWEDFVDPCSNLRTAVNILRRCLLCSKDWCFGRDEFYSRNNPNKERKMPEFLKAKEDNGLPGMFCSLKRRACRMEFTSDQNGTEGNIVRDNRVLRLYNQLGMLKSEDDRIIILNRLLFTLAYCLGIMDVAESVLPTTEVKLKDENFCVEDFMTSSSPSSEAKHEEENLYEKDVKQSSLPANEAQHEDENKFVGCVQISLPTTRVHLEEENNTVENVTDPSAVCSVM